MAPRISIRSVPLLVIASSLVLVFGSGSFPAKANNTEKTVSSIRAHCAEVNRSLKFDRKIRRNVEGKSAEGGSLVAYFKADSPRKIIATYYGETGKAIEEYYFWREVPCFVFRKEFHYRRPIGVEVNTRVRSTSEDHFYLHNGRLIRWLNSRGKELPLKGQNAHQEEIYLLSSARELLNLAKSKPHG